MNHRHPKVGEELAFAFSDTDIRSGVVLAHSEIEAWPGACDVTMEFMIALVEGVELTMTRYSIMPEEEQDWNLDGTETMITVFPLPGKLPASFFERMAKNAANTATPDA